MDEGEEDPEWRARIVRGASQPIGWWLGAQSLKEAADVLAKELQRSEELVLQSESNTGADEFSLRRVYMMLIGYALESLLKGMLVRASPNEYVRDERRIFTWGPEGHDLLSLARQAGMELAPDENDLCRRLTVFTTWAGRYWFPMVPQRRRGFSEVLDMSPNDQPVAERLFDAWSSSLESRMKSDGS